MTEREEHENSSHHRFPYFFANAGTEGDVGVAGINFRAIWRYGNKGDLLIYYNTLDDSGENPNYVECWCSRWDVQDYSIIISTWLKKEDVETLKGAIMPGATAELYNILGIPRYYDKTWVGSNTLLFVPVQYKRKPKEEPWELEYTDSNLKFMRDKRIGYIKNVTEHTIKGNKGFIEMKFECNISGTTL